MGIVGLGGVGHMGVKFARAFGAKVVVFTTSENKRAEALKLGADNVVLSRNPIEMEAWTGKIDFILNTVSADIDLNEYLNCLKRDDTLALVGIPEKPACIHAFSLIAKHRKLVG